MTNDNYKAVVELTRRLRATVAEARKIAGEIEALGGSVSFVGNKRSETGALNLSTGRLKPVLEARVAVHLGTDQSEGDA